MAPNRSSLHRLAPVALSALGIFGALLMIFAGLVALNHTVLPFRGWPLDGERSDTGKQVLPRAPVETGRLRTAPGGALAGPLTGAAPLVPAVAASLTPTPQVTVLVRHRAAHPVASHPTAGPAPATPQQPAPTQQPAATPQPTPVATPAPAPAAPVVVGTAPVSRRPATSATSPSSSPSRSPASPGNGRGHGYGRAHAPGQVKKAAAAAAPAPPAVAPPVPAAAPAADDGPGNGRGNGHGPPPWAHGHH